MLTLLGGQVSAPIGPGYPVTPAPDDSIRNRFCCNPKDGYIPRILKIIFRRLYQCAPLNGELPNHHPWAMVGNAQRQRLQKLHRLQRRLCNLQIPHRIREFESHPHRQNRNYSIGDLARQWRISREIVRLLVKTSKESSRSGFSATTVSFG